MRKDLGFYETAVVVDVSVADQAMPLGTRAIYVGGTGNLAVEMWDGGNFTFVAPQVGQELRIRARTILNSGTTATGLIALL